MDHFLRILFDQTINGLVIGNVYALIAVGLAIMFGVANLINFAHGSVYMLGAYIGWVCVMRANLPLPVAFAVVAVACGILGIVIERLGLRGLQNSARIAPLLATIGISFMLDQITQLIFGAKPQPFPNPLPRIDFQLGGVNIGSLDLLIAGTGLSAALFLFVVLRYTKLGWALRATAQDRDAAQQMGVDVDAVNRTAFALASILGGVAGLLVGMYFQTVYPTMSAQAVLKGFTAGLLGGLGNIPGAVIGGLVLGLIESYGVAALGASYRNLVAFIVLIAVLFFRPNGLFNPSRRQTPEPLTGTFVQNNRRVRLPRWLVAAAVIFTIVLPLIDHDPYHLQILIGAWLLALVALSVTLVTGTAGQISLGQAGFLAIGAYTSALLTLRLHWPFELALISAALLTALLGTLMVFPAFRLRAYYLAIATIGIGEIVSQVALNWTSLTRGALGLVGIPLPSLFGHVAALPPAPDMYWYALAILLLAMLFQWRLVSSSLGRIWRALREDEIAAQAYGINLNRYKALAFASSAFIAGLSGAFTAHMYTYLSYNTFPSSLSTLALTMAILGGMGNIVGAVVGALLLTLLPEVFRFSTDLRYLIYGLALVLFIRFRPQGLLGTD